ncbi:MAG: crossover junction endodeoxyribonuclease RuvC [Planctomycetes bacterium]|nr:crossover junction endodeoxyribonuclease RuvC [Planctomycetota bacterium]
MIILGIDPGLQVCGYAVIKAELLRTVLLEAGVFRTDGKKDLGQRLNQLAEDVRQVLQKYKPGVAAVEELYSHYQHPRTAILMGHARGILLQQAVAMGAEVRSFSATRIKKALTGNGHAGKAQMQRAIQSTLALAKLPTPADVADAIAVALCCINDRRIK